MPWAGTPPTGQGVEEKSSRFISSFRGETLKYLMWGLFNGGFLGFWGGGFC